MGSSTSKTVPVIGLYSPARQSGKSTSANLVQDILARAGWKSRTLAFAEPLKLATCAFLEALGLSDADATRYVYEQRDKVIPSLGRTAREFLVKLGTDAGRVFVGQDCWVTRWDRIAASYIKERTAIVCDDVRMPNEADAIRAAGGVMLEIYRPDELRRAGDSPVDETTEGRLTGLCHTTLINDGTLEQLRVKLGRTLRDLKVIK